MAFYKLCTKCGGDVVGDARDGDTYQCVQCGKVYYGAQTLFARYIATLAENKHGNERTSFAV